MLEDFQSGRCSIYDILPGWILNVHGIRLIAKPVDDWIQCLCKLPQRSDLFISSAPDDHDLLAKESHR